MSTVSAGKAVKDDALVSVSTPGAEGPRVIITSPVRMLFSTAQDRIIRETLERLDASDLDVQIQDLQALDFVLAARLRAAISRYRGGENQ